MGETRNYINSFFVVEGGKEKDELQLSYSEKRGGGRGQAGKKSL
jgi:hypothetical protein